MNQELLEKSLKFALTRETLEKNLEVDWFAASLLEYWCLSDRVKTGINIPCRKHSLLGIHGD